MKQFKLLIITIIYILSIDVHANGGPIDGSAVYRTGNIVLLKYERIKLEKEILKIKVQGDYSIINLSSINI